MVEEFYDTFLGCSQGGINLFKEKLREVVVCGGMGFVKVWHFQDIVAELS